MRKFFNIFDGIFIRWMRNHSITLLRITLGVVFLWFGALKIFGVSPVAGLVEITYWFMPYPTFFKVLGVWETVIGLGLMFKVSLRLTLGLLWVQMLGTLIAPLLAPSLFFVNGNPLLLTILGEFVIKNLVLVSAGLVIGGYEIKDLAKSTRT